MTEKTKAIEELSYEEARDELTRVLSELEAGSVALEESMKLWERGEALAKLCETLLAGARKKIEATLKDSAE
jgi:exodeoxyribonuclease VII small subunit